MAKGKQTIPKPDQIDWEIKAQEYLVGWQRTQADFDNYRRRIEATKNELIQMAMAESLLRIAPILDDFRRAFDHVPAEERTAAWVQGMQQVEKRLQSILEQAGLHPINEKDVEFNPLLHEAIAYENHAQKPEGTVIDIVELGWQVGDKVIKPAKVRVSKGSTH